MRKTLLWLDNAVNPYFGGVLNLYSPIGSDVKVVWAHNYTDFEKYILSEGLPDAISFDYDLGEEKTGFECARFLTRYCMNYAFPLPKYTFHFEDRYGVEAMNLVLDRYKVFYDSLNPVSDYEKLMTGGNENKLPF